MEQIISKLSEIESTASQIMEEAQRRKEELSQEYQEQCREYDRQADVQAEEEVRRIRTRLEADQKARLADLKKQTEDGFARMEKYYTRHHQELAREIYEKIIHA